jgi:aryl-alcohol dehydrogenase-like predicted oxidoreductase
MYPAWRRIVIPPLAFDPMTARLGLGMAALGRPGYVTLNHASDLGGSYDPSVMESHAHAVLDAAYDAGIRYIDAARSYGRAEDFVASWLRKRAIEPGEVTVASKWGYTYTAGWSTSATQHEVKDHSLAAFERQLAESVERLGRYLSLYQIHSVTAESKTLEDNALIDAIARLRERGIRAGLTVSGAGQDVAIRRSLEVRRDGVRVFDSVQATWNLLERGAESALEEAYAEGMKVVVKEALANGRLTQGNRDEGDVLFPAVARIREGAESRGTTIEMLALGAALARPWADVVLTGAATVGQIQSNVAALEVAYNPELEERLRSGSINSAEYWRARSSFRWN